MACVHYVSQAVAHDVIQEEQKKLKKTLAALSAAAVGKQSEKRRNLDSRLAILAKKATAVVDEQVRGYLYQSYTKKIFRSLGQSHESQLIAVGVFPSPRLCAFLKSSRRAERHLHCFC